MFFLFILLFLFPITAFLLILPEHFIEKLSDEGNVTIGNYVRITSSLSTIVSAIGAWS